MELKTNADTPDASSVQKAADFVQAFLLGMLLALFASRVFVSQLTLHAQLMHEAATHTNRDGWAPVSLLLLLIVLLLLQGLMWQMQ